MVHLTITRSEFGAERGVSGTKEGVEVGPGFCGVGSSMRTISGAFGFGFGSWSEKRCFLEAKCNGVESAFWGKCWWSSSSSERKIGCDIFFFVEESEGMWGREWESVEYRGE